MNLSVWDPTESVSTRPLFMVANPGNYKLFYTFDGNKNVSELVHFESRNGIAAHYDYAPFGAVTRTVNTSAISSRNFHLENPFRFSSEYHDDTVILKRIEKRIDLPLAKEVEEYSKRRSNMEWISPIKPPMFSPSLPRVMAPPVNIVPSAPSTYFISGGARGMCRQHLVPGVY